MTRKVLSLNMINRETKTTMTTEIFLNQFDYSDIKQSVEYKIFRRLTNDEFAPYWHNVSYFVPVEITSDKWQTIHFLTKLLANDLTIS